MNKVGKTIGLPRKLQAALPRPSLVTIYKAFIRPHLEYGDIIYDQAYKESVCSHHVIYAFQNESTLYSCLNVKELFARNRRDI